MDRHLALLLSSFSLFFLGACETLNPTPPSELDLWADAGGDIQHPELAEIATEFWETYLEHDPFEATALGDPRYHGDIPLTDQRALANYIRTLDGFESRLRGLRKAPLSASDRLSFELLEEEIEFLRTEKDLFLQAWNVDPLRGPHIEILNLVAIQPFETPRERRQLVERWNGFGSYIRQAARNLDIGRSQRKFASRTAIAKVIGQLNDILAVDPMESPLVQIATGGGRWVPLPAGGNVAEIAHRELGDSREQRVLRTVNLHLQEGERTAIGTRVLIPNPEDQLDPVERGQFLSAVLKAVETEIYPALTSYRDLLQTRILPGARSDETPGLAHIAGGADIYRKMIRRHTSLPSDECDPRAIHEFGLAEVARIREEIATLGERMFGTRSVPEIQARLRSDPELHFANRAEVSAKAVESLVRARKAMPAFFGILPEADCVVVPIPAHEERDSTIAYYNQPNPEGDRPGQYFINTYAPETRPRYEAEVLAYHEAIPGHHLQIAIAQELSSLPRFRRHMGSTAFVEGWALYTERLCEDMGLYSSDVDRFGVLSFDAWRASRLVVDTGLHSFGWSREEAIEYMYANTLLARNNIENEVDRYIAWPGQALAYKIGQREILNLREEAQTTLGAAYSHPEFHDRILENGAVSLSVLRRVVQRWLSER